MTIGEVDDLLTKKPLDPKTNLPMDEKLQEVNEMLLVGGQGAALRAPSSVQMGSYGPPGRLVGESQYDVNILPEDIFYGNNLEGIRSMNQPGWHMLGNAVIQMAAEVVGGTVENIGYLGDLGAWGNLIKRDEYDFGNAVSEWGAKLKEKSKEAAPIYTSYEPGGFEPGNWSWWMNNASSIASSISLLIPSYAGMKALSMVGKGLKLMNAMTNSAKAIGMSTKTFNMISKGVTRAVMSRHAESMMESNQLYQEIYKKNLSIGLSETEAKENASKAAAQVYNRNWYMLLQDIPQYMLLGSKGILPRASVKNTVATAKAMGKKTMPIHMKNSLKYGTDMLGEGAEEGYQYIVQKEGEYMARMLLNPDEDPTTFGYRLQEYIQDGEMQTSMFMGALGAGAMHITGRASDKIREAIKDRIGEEEIPADGEVKPKARVKPRVKDIHGFGAMMSRNYKNILRAYESENQDWIDQANDEGNVDMYMQSAINGNIDNLVDFFESAADPSEEDLQRWPELTPEVVAQMKEKRTELIQEARKFEKAYDENMKKVDKGILKNAEDAALLTREETLLNKLLSRKNEVTNRANEARKNIPRFNELSSPQRDIHGLTFEKQAVDKQLKWIEKLIKERDDISTKEKKPYKETAKKLKEISNALDTKIAENKANLTPEMKKSDKEKGITDEMFQEWKEALSSEVTLNSNIEEKKGTIDRIWKGEFTKPKPVKEEPADAVIGVPQEDDIVVYTDPETQEVLRGKVLNIDENKEDIYHITLLDDEGNQVLDDDGNIVVKPVDVNNLEIDYKASIAYNQSEPINDNEHNENLDNYHNKGLRSVSSSISYIDRGNWDDKIRIRDTKLWKYASSPAHSMQKAKFEFYLPLKDSIEGETYIKEFYEKNPKLKEKIKAGTITAAEIQTILSFEEDHFYYPVDQIPIGIKVTDGSEVFDGDIGYHDSSYDNMVIPTSVLREAIDNPDAIDNYIKSEQEATRAERAEILSALLAGDGYHMTGGETKVKSTGHPNHKPWDAKNRLRPVSEVFGKDNKDISLYVGNNEGRMDNGTVETDGIVGIDSIVTPGGIYAPTTKTANGEEATVKLNYSKLTPEHADILFEAIMQRYAPGNAGGSVKPSKDSRVENLTVGEVISLLVRFGENATSVEANKDDWEDILEHKIHKQLYVDNKRKYPALIFGENEFDIYRKKGREAAKKKFIEWATTYKNYQVYIHNDDLGISSMDRPFEKEFKLGSVVYKGDSTYQQYVLDNNMVMTDLEEFVPGSLFEGPVIEMDTTTGTVVKYRTNDKSPRTKSQVTSKKKPIPASKKKATTPKQKEQQAFIEDTNQKVKTLDLRGDEVEINNASQLAKLPVGTVIKFNQWSVKRIKGEYHDTEFFSAIGTVDANGALAIFNSLKSTDKYLRLDKKKLSDPDLFDLLKVTGSTIPNHRIIAKVPEAHTPEVEEAKPPVVEPPKLSITKVKENAPQTKVEPIVSEEEPDELDPLPGHDKIYRLMIPREYEVQDLDKELQVVYKMLGSKVANNFDMVDKLIPIAQSGRQAFAKYTHDAIILFSGAEKGTVYHEAFHRVSLGYLNNIERQRLYDAARKQYPERLEVANNREVEEFLAEKFREYVMSKQHTDSKGKVKGFFRRLFEWIKAWFTGPSRLSTSEVDRMFNTIYKGYYSGREVVKENAADLSAFEYWRATIPSINTAAKMKKVVKGLTATLFELNSVEELDHNLDKLDWGQLQNELRSRINTYKKYVKNNRRKNGEPLRPVDIEHANNIITLYSEILGYNPKSGLNENFPFMREEMLSYMRSIGIRTVDNDEHEIEMGNDGIVLHDKMSHEVSVKANAQGSIKLLIATSPKSRKLDPFTNMLEFVDYNEAWSMLLEDLAHLDNIAEMIEVLENERDDSNKYFYHHVLSKLNQDDPTMRALFRAQFEVTIKKHGHSYVNLIIEEDESGDFDYTFTDANLSKGSRLAKETWSQNLYMSHLMIKEAGKDDVLKRSRNTPKGQESIDTLNARRKAIAADLNNIKKTPEFFEKQMMFREYFKSIFNSIGIPLDDETIKEYKSMNKYNDLETLLNLSSDLYKIFNDILTRYKPGKKGLVANRLYDNSHLNPIAEAYARANPRLTNDMIMGPANATYYKFSNNSHVTSKTREYNNNKDHVQSMLNCRGMANSKFLQQWLDPTVKVSVKTYAGAYLKNSGDRGRDYFDITPLEDYIMKAHAYLAGYVPFPTLADKGTYYLLEGLTTVDISKITIDEESGEVLIPDEVLEVFMGYAKDEFDRIQGVKKDIKNKDKHRNKMIENYHYVLDKNGRRNYKDANGLKYYLFPGLSTEKFNIETVKKQITKGLTDSINAEIAYALEIEALRLAKLGKAKGTITRGLMGGEIFKKLREEQGSNAAATKVMVASYALKAIQSNIEIYKLYVGDPAAFKEKNDSVSDDLGKRLGAMIGSGEHMVEHIEHWGDSVKETTYSVGTIQTQLLESKYYPQLLELHTKALIRQGEKIKGSKLNDEEIARAKTRAEMIVKPYLAMDQSDGQAFITPRLYRAISIKIGEWSHIKENAYNLLNSTQTLDAEQERLAMQAIMQPIKPVYYSQDKERFGNEDVLVTIYDKMSMAPLFRRVVQGTQAEAILDRMEGKGQFEGRPRIDMLKMDSVTKVGNRGAVKLFEDPTTQNLLALDNLAKMPVFKQYYKSLRRQLVTDPHESPVRKLGTQFIKIGFANLDPNEIYENGLTGEQLAKSINEGLSSLAEFGNQELKKRLGFKNGKPNQKMLANELRREAQLANMPMTVVDAIKYDEINDKLYLQLDSMPNRKWYQSRLISLINKYVIDRKFAGGQYIQVSNLGLKKDELRVMKREETDLKELKFIHLDEEGKLQPMEALVSVSLFKNVIPGYENMTWKEKVKYIRKQKLDIIGYRIPTQGQNSTVVLRIGGILPEQAGDAVILPAEFTTLTGSDFDIDKLFLARPNYEIDYKGNVKEIDYLTGNQFHKQYNRMIRYQWGLYRDLLGDDFNDWYYDNHMDEEEDLKKAVGKTAEIDAQIQAIYEQIATIKSSKEGKDVDVKRAMNRVLTHLEYKIAGLADERAPLAEDEKELKQGKKKILQERKIEELIKLGVLPTFEEFQNLPEIKRNVPKAIQNRILSDYRNVLTSENNIISSTSPLVGNLAGEQLKELADDVAAMKDKYVYKGMMSIVSLASQNEAKMRYGSGSGGVGPFALHNAHHVLTQNAKVNMPNRGVSALQHITNGRVDFSQIYGTDGLPILDWTSALIDAHVDLPTNPYILKLNVNAFTYNAVGYLVRSGVGKTTFEFLAQPALAEAAELYLRRHGSKLLENYNEARVIDTIKRKYLKALGYYKTSISDVEKAKIDSDIERYKKALLHNKSNNLEKSVIRGDFAENETEFNKIQVAVLSKFEDIGSEADTFNKLIKASGIDTEKWGSSLAEFTLFMKNVNEARALGLTGEIGNASKIVGSEDGAKADDLFTASYFEHGAELLEQLFGAQTIMALPSVMGLIDIITEVAGPSISRNAYNIGQVYDAVYTALVSKNIFANPQFFGFTRNGIMNLIWGKFKTNEETKERELIEEDTIFQQFVRLNEKYPELKENPFFQRLNVKTENNPKVSLIKNAFTFVRTDFNDPWETESIITGWEDLIDSPVSEISSFGKNLIVYSAITTGMQARLNSFWNYVPPKYMKSVDMKGRTISFDDGILALHKKLQSPLEIEESIEIMDKVFRHVKDLRPDITARNKELVVVGTEHKLISPSSATTKLPSFADGAPSFRPYVTFGNNVYKWAGYYKKKGNILPVYRRVNKLGYFRGGRNITEYAYDGSLLKENYIKDSQGNVVTEEFKEDKFLKFARKHYGDTFVYMSDEDIFYGEDIEYEQDIETSITEGELVDKDIVKPEIIEQSPLSVEEQEEGKKVRKDCEGQ